MQIINFRSMFRSILVLSCLFSWHWCSSNYLSPTERISDNTRFPGDIVFTIFSTNLNGDIVYITDTINDIRIWISRQDNGNYVIFMKFNNKTKYQLLEKFCGPMVIKNRLMKFVIIRIYNCLEVACNGGEKMYLYTYDDYNESLNRSIDIYMGNYKQSQYSQLDEDKQLYGCLKDFTYKGHEVKFEGKGKKFLSKCKDSCMNPECNDSECRSMYKVTESCNCSLSIKKTKFCNEFSKDDTPFVYSSNNNTHFTSLKFSWTNQKRSFIILEIQTLNEIIQISVKDLNVVHFRRNNSIGEFFKCGHSGNDSAIKELFVNASRDIYHFRCNGNEKEMPLKFNGRIRQIINNAFKNEGNRTGLCHCYISLTYEPGNWHTNWELEVSESVMNMKFFEEALLLFIILSAIGALLIILFAMVTLIWYWQHVKERKPKISNASTTVIELADKPEEQEYSSPEDDSIQIYDQLTYDQIDSTVYTSEEDDYMPMSPTLPPRVYFCHISNVN